MTAAPFTSSQPVPGVGASKWKWVVGAAAVGLARRRCRYRCHRRRSSVSATATTNSVGLVTQLLRASTARSAARGVDEPAPRRRMAAGAPPATIALRPARPARPPSPRRRSPTVPSHAAAQEGRRESSSRLRAGRARPASVDRRRRRRRSRPPGAPPRRFRRRSLRRAATAASTGDRPGRSRTRTIRATEVSRSLRLVSRTSRRDWVSLASLFPSRSEP